MKRLQFRSSPYPMLPGAFAQTGRLIPFQAHRIERQTPGKLDLCQESHYEAAQLILD